MLQNDPLILQTLLSLGFLKEVKVFLFFFS